MNTMKHGTLLFIGDSITDANRRNDPEGIGYGYVRHVRDMLWVRHAEAVLEVRNRGISGDTIRHLERRWEKDVLAEQPSALSVSIGVNDVWRHFQDPPNPEAVPLEEFTATYRRVLCLTHDALPDCQIFLCEPTPISEERDSAQNRFMVSYLEALPSIAREVGAHFVPMNQAFWRAKDATPNRTWTTDGVHPASQGHMLMALTFVETWERVV